MKRNVDKIALEISEKVNQFENWINDMKASDNNMEIPQVIAESIQEIITNSAPSLAVAEIRGEFEILKGEVMSGRDVTEMLRDLVVNLKFQLDSNISQSSNQSINLEHTRNNNNSQESSSSLRKREIVRKGIERLERQINQLLVTKIPMDKSDIALINKIKVVDIPSLNSAVRNIQKALQKYVNFSGTDYEYCDTISNLMDKAQSWSLQVEAAYNEAEVHSINTSKGDDTEVGVFSDNAEIKIFEFLETAELAYLGKGNSTQKANRLFNKHLSEEI